MKKIHDQLENQGIEIFTEGATTAYFYNDELVAMKRDRDLTIFGTPEEKVSELYNIMLADTQFEHYINKGVNYFTTEDGQRRVMEQSFTWRIL